MGSSLARLSLTTLFEEVARRMQDIELAGPVGTRAVVVVEQPDVAADHVHPGAREVT
jgi:cytochrome P450